MAESYPLNGFPDETVPSALVSSLTAADYSSSGSELRAISRFVKPSFQKVADWGPQLQVFRSLDSVSLFPFEAPPEGRELGLDPGAEQSLSARGGSGSGGAGRGATS